MNLKIAVEKPLINVKYPEIIGISIGKDLLPRARWLTQ